MSVFGIVHGWIARFARLSMYELLLAVPEPRSGFFSLLVQRKEPKRKHAPNGANGFCAPLLQSEHRSPPRGLRETLSESERALLSFARCAGMCEFLEGAGCAGAMSATHKSS